MQITVREFNPSNIRPASDAVQHRSPGLHLSQIYDDLADTIKPRKPMSDARDIQSYRAGGFIWERVLETSFSTAFGDSLIDADTVRPGEVYRDGIWASPDLLHLPTFTVVDTKFTWRSSRRLEVPEGVGLATALNNHFWTWTVQLKGYCQMLNTTLARLLVFFVNGNYADSGPQLRQFDLTFTNRELDENWSMLLNHARKRGWLPSQ